MSAVAKQDEDIIKAQQKGCVKEILVLVFHEGKLWVPDEPSLKTEVLFEAHDSAIAGHTGIDKTLEQL